MVVGIGAPRPGRGGRWDHSTRYVDNCQVNCRHLSRYPFLIAHGAAAPFTLTPLARRLDATDPLDPTEIDRHAAAIADILTSGLRLDRGCEVSADPDQTGQQSGDG
jgi:hypothetical protein